MDFLLVAPSICQALDLSDVLRVQMKMQNILIQVIWEESSWAIIRILKNNIWFQESHSNKAREIHILIQ